MSGLFTSLNAASQNLDAQRYGLDVTGQNIANLNTEGYTRRRLDLAERLPVNGVGGVEVLGVRATRDAFVDQRLRNELPGESRDSTTYAALSVVETSLGAAGQSIDGALSALFGAFSTLSIDPQSSVARDGVLQQARRLAGAFNEMAQRLGDSRQQADSDIRGSVDTINQLTTTIASLNRAIGDAPVGGDIEALRDRLDVALQSLSKITNVQVTSKPNNTVDVTVASGRPLVIGATSYDLTVSNAAGTGLAEVRAQGADITSGLQSGSLGGLLAVRDQMIPAYQAQLDQLAYDVTTQVNAVHSTGFDLSGTTGAMLFLPLSAVAGAAEAMRIDPGVAADPSKIAASATGAVGDNGTARALAALRDADVARGGTSTFMESWGLLVNKVGSDVASVKSSLSTRQDVVSSIQRLRDSVSGVSLDEEAGRLMQFQRAYEANARFFSAVDNTLSVLMSTLGAMR